MSQAGEEGPQGHDETSPWNDPGSVQLRPEMADHSQKQQVACLPEDKAKGQKVLPRCADQKVDGVAEGTHLKTAVYQADVHGGDVKMSLDLCDGTLHVRRRHRSRETGEG